LKFKLSRLVLVMIVFAFLGSFCLVNASQVSSINVDAGYSNTLTYNLDSGQRFSGSISISGGSGNDVNFWVTNPQGAKIVNSGRVSGGTSFDFTAQSSGAYTLHFDNAFSIFSSKSVQLTYDVTSPSGGLTGGSGLSLTLIIAVFAIAFILVLIIFVIALSRRGKASSNSQQFPPPPPPQ
jgi:preprotein translocase subunit SecG